VCVLTVYAARGDEKCELILGVTSEIETVVKQYTEAKGLPHSSITISTSYLYLSVW
jgi:hypothetical protein